MGQPVFFRVNFLSENALSDSDQTAKLLETRFTKTIVVVKIFDNNSDHSRIY